MPIESIRGLGAGERAPLRRAECRAAAFRIWAEHFDRAGASRALWAFAADHDTLASLGSSVGLSFGVAVAYVGRGWIALLTFAARWQREAGGPSECDCEP